MVKLVALAVSMVLGLGVLAAQLPLEYGGSGGLGGLAFWRLGDLSDLLSRAGFPALPGRALLRGGYAVGGEAPGPGVGGMGISISAAAAGGGREVKLELGYGALMLERAFPLGKQALAGLGAALGGGEAKLTLVFRKPEDIGAALGSPFETRLRAPFWGLIPYLRLVAAPTDWFTIEGWLGYLLTVPQAWQAAGEGLGAGPQFSGPLIFVSFSLGSIWSGEDPGAS